MNVSVVYPVLQAGIELKYSVRSVLMHGSNVGRIYVIGDKPGYLNDELFEHIPFADKRGKPYENVWRKLKAAAEDERISSRILWMNDDIYITRAFDAAAVPNYCRSLDLATMPTLKRDLQSLSSYKKVLKNTLDALKKRGMSTHHFGTHQPVNFEKEKILATWKEFEADVPLGISFRCCYHNMHGSERTIKSTAVVSTLDGLRPPAKWAFASKGNANLIALEQGLQTLYPHRSALEV